MIICELTIILLKCLDNIKDLEHTDSTVYSDILICLCQLHEGILKLKKYKYTCKLNEAKNPIKSKLIHSVNEMRQKLIQVGQEDTQCITDVG